MGPKKSKKGSSKKGKSKSPKKEPGDAPPEPADGITLAKLNAKLEQMEGCLKDKIELESRRQRDELRETVKCATTVFTEFKKDYDAMKAEQTLLKQELSKVKRIVTRIANQKPKESDPCLDIEDSETEMTSQPCQSRSKESPPCDQKNSSEDMAEVNRCLVEAVRKLTGHDITQIVIDYEKKGDCKKENKIKKVLDKGPFPAHQSKWSAWMKSCGKPETNLDLCPTPRCLTCTPIVVKQCCGEQE